MPQTIHKIVALTAIALMLFILWAFQLVWVRSYEATPMVMSGDAMAMTLVSPVSDDGPRWSQASVNAYWSRKLNASTDCPVVRINPDQIEHAITGIGQLHLTEAEADRAAKRDFSENTARVYLPATGAGQRTCAVAIAMKAKGVRVTLLNSMPRDTYGYQYVQRYNQVTMELAGQQIRAGT